MVNVSSQLATVAEKRSLPSGGLLQTEITVLNDLDGSYEYLAAREAEVLAMTDALRLQDAIPKVAAASLAGVVAKLEMIVGAGRDIGDPTDFPWPHIASALRNLKAIAGELPTSRPDRATTRADAKRHWEQAAKLIAALNEDEA